MPKKKSLADELADLFNPAPTKGERARTGPAHVWEPLGSAPPVGSCLAACRRQPPPPLPAHRSGALTSLPCSSSRFLLPEFDPEADVFGAGPALEESDEELAADASRK